MPETGTPFARMSRVTTRRGTLRQLNCPLEPELLVAEFSDELPPDVAVAVREHMAVCEICGKRAQELHMPYALLSSLGAAPAPYVPDLRETVRVKAARAERFLRPLRTLGSLSRFGLIVTVLALVTLLALGFGVTGLVRSLGVLTLQRTTNQISNAPAAAPQGALLAETDKLVTVSGSNGQSWQVAEVVVANQRNGSVARSLPASTGSLRQASAGTLPLAVFSDGRTVYELTPAQNNGRQALVAFDVTSGAARFITALALPDGVDLPDGVSAVSLALAPGGATAYVGLSGVNGALNGPRALAVSLSDGKVVKAISAALPQNIALPPPPGSLPASAFPSVVPYVSIQGMRQGLASGGAIVVSPDGQALFDSIVARDASGVRYVIVRRIDLTTGVVSVLGLPGDFTTTKLAVSGSASAPQVYLITGSPQATVFVLDASPAGPALAGQIALGGPAAPAAIHLQDTLNVGPAANGVWLYVTQDATSSDGTIAAHSRWLVDTQGMGVVASATDPVSAGALLGNSARGGKTFALVNGEIAIGATDLSSGWTPWFQTNDSTPIIALISTIP